MSEAHCRLIGRVNRIAPLETESMSRCFQPGRWLDVRERDVAPFSAICGHYERDFLVAGSMHAQDIDYFDLSLSGRPESSCGRFAGSSEDFQRTGRVIFVPAGYQYEGRGGPGPQRSLFLFLRRHSLQADEELSCAPFEGGLQKCLNLKSDVIEKLLVRIAKEMTVPGFASELLLEGLGLTLLAESGRMLKTLHEQDFRKGGLQQWRLRLIEDRIHHGHHLPTIAELAELCGISRRQLMRAFREETGQTLGMFIHQMTLKRAKALLLEGRRQISTIAIEVGFANAAAFSTAFRRATGMTPRDFRALHQVRDAAAEPVLGRDYIHASARAEARHPGH